MPVDHGHESHRDTLRARVSGLSDAWLQINGSLELPDVLSAVANSACSLADATYGSVVTVDDEGAVESLTSVGMTPTEQEVVLATPDGERFFQYLLAQQGPLRVRNLERSMHAAGLERFRSPLGVTSFLCTPIRQGERSVGFICLAERRGGEAFTEEDEEQLAMLAPHAALVIMNARLFGIEQSARSDLETLMHTSPVGVAVIDAESHHVTFLNRELQELLAEVPVVEGEAPSYMDLLGFRLSSGRLVSQSDYPLMETLMSKKAMRAEEVMIQFPSGRELPVMINATPIVGDDGVMHSSLVTLQDMTPRARLDELRSQLLSMVSQDLLTPVTSIKGCAAAALSDLSPGVQAEWRQLFHVVEQQADQLHHLVNGLLDLSRVETGTLSLELQPVDVQNLFERAQESLIASGCNRELEIDPGQGLPPVYADSVRIHHVLRQLLTLAAQSSSRQSPLVLAADIDMPNVAISVAGDGELAPVEALPSLFGNHGETEFGMRGSALGLALCRGIVEAHGGRIWASSPGPGQGTRITFTLPSLDVTTMPASSSPQWERGSEPPGRRALVIDDDQAMLSYVGEVLSGAGYYVTLAADLNDIEHLAAAADPDIVLVGVTFASRDASGVEAVLVRVRSIVEAPIVMLSGYVDDRQFSAVLSRWATDYIVQPFLANELLARVRGAIRSAESLNESDRQDEYSFKALRIDYSARRVTIHGSQVRLTPTEYQLLVELSSNPGRLMSHAELLERVWGQRNMNDSRMLRTVVKNLRRKLGDRATRPTYIITEPRQGYRMEPSDR
ncbi:MAG: winged helix-turn-helix domain-containing protein [Chloroflexi bacterium]|nr:winged helix-turn-helix domain-containing protein [Chloroflexota bacterium]